jgi:hypothetical protein
MSDQKLQGKTPTYSFQGSSPAEESLEIARIHHKEAKQLFEGAKAAEAEGRAEEARLLLDLAVARRERAEEFERVAQGQCGDPIVTEILDWQEDLCETYTPPTLEFHSKEDLAAAELERISNSAPTGTIARASSWISLKKEQYTRRALSACYSLLQAVDRSVGKE